MHSRLGRLGILRALIMPWLCVGTAAWAQTDSGHRFSGYFKSLLSHSTTLFPTQQSYNLDLNRLRLELRGQISRALAYEIQYDNEILLGSYLRTPQFGLQKSMRAPQRWQLEHAYADSPDVFARHRLYRGFMTFSSGATDIRIGRQRIALGTGRFWSPLDILNPISPIQLEREERLGVDAVLIERKLGALSRASGIYAPRRGGADPSAALYWHGNSAGADFSLMAGKFAGDRVFGGDVATQLGDAGLRGEITHTEPADGKNYRRVLLGLDYAFANTLTLSAELYYNGAGASGPDRYDFAALLDGRIRSLGQRYLGMFGSYEITPLLKTQNHFVINLQDNSRYFGPSLTYSLNESVDWTLGAQLFSGGGRSEHGRISNVYYTQVQWFF